LKNESSVVAGVCWNAENYRPGKRVGSAYKT